VTPDSAASVTVRYCPTCYNVIGHALAQASVAPAPQEAERYLMDIWCSLDLCVKARVMQQFPSGLDPVIAALRGRPTAEASAVHSALGKRYERPPFSVEAEYQKEASAAAQETKVAALVDAAERAIAFLGSLTLYTAAAEYDQDDTIQALRNAVVFASAGTAPQEEQS
jgi:hypothetical protein